MLKASPVFLNCFYRLVASIIREGRQKAENEKGRPLLYLKHFTNCFSYKILLTALVIKANQI